MATEISFGKWLKLRRRGLGLSQTEMGERLGYSGETIRKIEADSVRPSKQLAAKLADALESVPEKREAFIRFARGEGADPPPLPVFIPPLAPQPTRRIATNLPFPPTPLVGRETELAAGGELLQRSDTRLVTMTGPGGTGKTRLALEIAAKSLGDFSDGVYFVNLAPIADPMLIPRAIAQTLNVRDTSQPLLDLLKYHLRDKQLLLVLDNFEQVAPGAIVVGELLAQAAALKVLVTSRMPLHIRGEKEFPVAPLVLPDVEGPPSPERLLRYGSVQLFVQRARDVKPDFVITGENAAVVAEICHRLDGLPLALELAAPHIKAFPPADLLARLGSRLQALTHGPRDLPARQQSLRDTIAWSYNLLEEDERTLFRHVAVFAGGFTSEAVAAVCFPQGALIVDVLDGLAALMDKSLIYLSAEVRGEPRFFMLETIHEYARERLAEQGEADHLRQEHASFFLALAERAEPELTGSEQATRAARLEADHDNLRAALDWSLTPAGHPAIGLHLGGALWRFWMHRGYLTEGRLRLSAALARSTHLSAKETRAKALNGAAGLAYQQGDYAAARALNEQSLALRRDLEDSQGIARSLGNLGLVAHRQGDYGAARTCYVESLALERDLDDQWGMAWVLTALGLVAHDQGDYAEAQSLYHQALAINRALGSRRGIALVLANLAEVAYHQNDYATARSLFDQSLTLYQKADDRANMLLALHGLGNVARNQGDYPRADELYRQSLTLGREMEDKRAIAECLEGVAGMWTMQGQCEGAARLFAATAALREAIGGPLPPAGRTEVDQYMATVRSQLGDAEFLMAWTLGRSMTLNQATAHVLGKEVE